MRERLGARSSQERSQLKNRELAMSMLRARLYEIKMREQQDAVSAARKSQVGSGARSEKIRTYNWKVAHADADLCSQQRH